jgi:Cd2+/Zn2+-exporting ATPase
MERTKSHIHHRDKDACDEAKDDHRSSTRINLDILLPSVPDERDECVHRIIKALAYKKGLDKVHIIPGSGAGKAQLCFHYDPSVISVNDVEVIAKKAGAEITEHFGHLLIEVTGIRQPRHARIIEAQLKRLEGVLNVSVSGTGFIQLEYNKKKTGEEKIVSRLEHSGLSIDRIQNLAGNGHAPLLAREKPLTDVKHQHHHPEHKHDHHGIFGERTELIFAIICGAFLLSGFLLSFVPGISKFISIGLYIGAYLFGGFFTSKEAIAGISKGEFEIDFLMLVAAIGAAFLGQWAEGALLLFLFSLGHSLEHYAMAKAKKSIESLTDLAPKTALIKQEEELIEVWIEELRTGDTIVVKPNSKISADGFIVKGESSVNQAPITGESMPVDKMPVEDADITLKAAEKLDEKHRVFAGSINGSELLEVKVTRPAEDSTIARLVKLVNEAQTQKSPTQNFADKLEKYYVPAVLLLVTILLFAFVVIDEPFSASFYRAMSVLVAASPCALAISTPSAVLSGVARAARGGVLVKGGRPLEELGSLTAIAFDKTGTLTEGKPKLTGVYPLNGVSEEEILETIVAIEKLSDHPLAAAIVKGGIERLERDVSAATNVEAIQGRGVRALYNNKEIHIGNKELFTEKDDQVPEGIRSQAEALEMLGNTTMLVQRDKKFIAIITLMDIARKDAKETLAELKKKGIRKMIMLTGDNQKVAEAIAKDIGMTDAWGNLLPEQKVAAIEKLRKDEKKVAMVGDGVNDAPAMAKSTVGIAMGAAGSDVALETADIALMADQLSNLPFAIGLSRKAKKIIKQNVIISLGMVAILIPLTITGIAHMGPAVIGHEGSTIVVVFNALRLLVYKK